MFSQVLRQNVFVGAPLAATTALMSSECADLRGILDPGCALHKFIEQIILGYT